MNKEFEDYIKRVKEQLVCNATDDYKKSYITYGHSNEKVDSHLGYFRKCMHDGLSEYKALLFFEFYLDE
jgi:hypothetical protein